MPVLEISSHEGAPFRVPDSLRSMEYLEDVQKSDIIPRFYRFLKTDRNSSQADQAKEQMLAGLLLFAEAMPSEGPYFTGSALNIVDFAFAPFALHIELLLEQYKGFTLPTSGESWARYATWWAAMKTHPAFLSTIPGPETYEVSLIEFYLPYSQGGGQEDVTSLS